MIKKTVPKYELVRCARKSIGIYIKEGVVTVRAPRRASVRAIDAFVLSKADWIAKHSSAQRERLAARAEFSVDYGDCAPLLGREFPIVAAEGRAGFDGEKFSVPRGMDSAAIKNLLTLVYRDVAGTYLRNRTLQIAEKMNAAPTAIRINSAKTRWGSCGGKNSINYSWRLILAEPAAVDYVIVHELAHTFRHDHSPAFWAIVQRYVPDWRERRQSLRRLQERLSREGW